MKDVQANAVQSKFAAEDAAVGKPTGRDVWRAVRSVLLWLAIGMVLFAVLRIIWR